MPKTRELDLLRDLVYRLCRAGRFEDARSVAESIATLWPDDSAGHGLLGALAERCGNRREAGLAYERALERDPTDAASILGLGRLRIRAGEVAHGLELVRRAWVLEQRKETEVALLARALLDSYGG